MKKIFFLIGGIVLLSLIGLGFYWYNKPHSNAANEDTDFRISATDLYAAFQKDEGASNKKFMGRVIEVRGAISDLETAGATTNILMSASPMGGISCSFSKGGLPAAGAPRKGTVVTIKGRCTGFLMDVNLVDCTVKE